MHTLILDDGEQSLGIFEEIPKFCPATKVRLGTVIIGLPLTRGRLAFGSDTRCTYINGALVTLNSGAEYQSLKLLRVDTNCSMATCGDGTFNMKVHQMVAEKAMTEMPTADGLASLVKETMHRYYRKSIKPGIFLGVIEESESRLFHLRTCPSGIRKFYESRGYLLDGSCYGDAMKYLAQHYDPNMEDIEVLQLLKHGVNLTAGRAISDSIIDA